MARVMAGSGPADFLRMHDVRLEQGGRRAGVRRAGLRGRRAGLLREIAPGEPRPGLAQYLGPRPGSQVPGLHSLRLEPGAAVPGRIQESARARLLVRSTGERGRTPGLGTRFPLRESEKISAS